MENCGVNMDEEEIGRYYGQGYNAYRDELRLN